MQHVHSVLTLLLFTLTAHTAVASPPSASAIFAADTAERVATLVNLGADLWATNGDCSTPLHVALVNGRAEAALAMIAHGAPVSARDVYGRTPLHIAASTGNVEVARALLGAGADVDALALADVTPLHAATRAGQTPVTDDLVAAGADASIRPGSKAAQVAALFARESAADVPGAAVFVARGDTVLLEAAYGMANLEHGILLTPRMKFRIASLTKQLSPRQYSSCKNAGRYVWMTRWRSM